jgi:hypothetical protein
VFLYTSSTDTLYIYRVIRNNYPGFTNLPHTTHCRQQYAVAPMDQGILKSFLLRCAVCSSYALLIMVMLQYADSYRQFGTDWIVLLLSVESQTVHIYSGCEVFNLLVTRCTIKFDIQELCVLPKLYLCVV